MNDAQLLDLHFDTPPVVEVIFGLEYAPVPGWKIPHFGLYWSKIRDEYPECETLPPLAARPRIEVVAVPLVRCLFSNDAEQKVVQVQEDRFYYNWRKVTSADAYPKYSVIRPIFDKEWSRFRHFLSSEEMNEPVVTSCELTYVNHLRRGIEWNDLSDLPDIFEIVGNNSATRTQGMQQFLTVIAVPLDGAEGMTTLNIQPAMTASTGEQIIQFSVSVQGRPASGDASGISTWFDAAHRAIRFNFHRATTSSMHKLWALRKS